VNCGMFRDALSISEVMWDFEDDELCGPASICLLQFNQHEAPYVFDG
jgi:hypothetical protein